MFKNRNLIIATKHKKEEVIRPIFESDLGVQCQVPADFDSDALGTFSGEIERTLSPIEAAREKCRLIAERSSADLIIASEGSFGPHPLIGFVPFDEEVLMFKDLRNDLEITVSERSLKTNFSSEEVANVHDLLAFSRKVLFPTHGLILNATILGKQNFVKGIVNEGELVRSFNELKPYASKIIAQTDMRALFNPTRMAVIKQAAIKLVKKVKTSCPKCSAPGFGPERSLPGLVCSRCALPTRSVKAHVYECKKCSYEQIVELENGKKSEDPMYCDFCNP